MGSTQATEACITVDDVSIRFSSSGCSATPVAKLPTQSLLPTIDTDAPERTSLNVVNISTFVEVLESS